MNVGFVLAILASSVLLSFSGPGAAGGDRGLAETILSDPLLDEVEAMAREKIRSGVNAGDGYGAVWIRDFNTLENLALEVLPAKDIEDVLVMFMLMQEENGSILDGYTEAGKNDQQNEYRFAAVKDYVGHKNTVETDQESSFILAVCKYVKKTGDKSFLLKEVGGMSVSGHVEAAISYLLTCRFDKVHGLLWGGTTCDWGDVQPENSRGVILDASSHRCIDIYDNALFISALNAWLEVAPDDGSVKKWKVVRDSFKDNVMKFLWDGEKNKFRPHLYLDGSPFPEEFDEDAIMFNGGTSVAMEAGLLNKRQIRKTNAMMLSNMKAAGASSVGMTIYPAYPTGYFKHPVLAVAYTYQNGGDWTWFGARYITQLAKAGFIREAYEEVRPMLQRTVDFGDFHEWYTLDGEPRGSSGYRGAAGVLYDAINELRSWAATHLRN